MYPFWIILQSILGGNLKKKITSSFMFDVLLGFRSFMLMGWYEPCLR